MEKTVLITPGLRVPNAVAELEAREAVIAAEFSKLDTRASQEIIAEELFLIHTKKLYKAAGIKSLEAYLRTRRTQICRARAYQLIAFAKAKHRAATAGVPPPANERQCRADKRCDDDLDAFGRRWSPVFRYLWKKFHSFPKPERPRFVEVLELATRTFSHCARNQDQGG
jgi:hypothetical protein